MSAVKPTAANEAASTTFEWDGRDDSCDGAAGLNEVVEGLYLCGQDPGADRGIARAYGVRVVVCCNADPAWPQWCRHDPTNGVGAAAYKAIATKDAFIDEIRRLGPRESVEDAATLVYNIAADDSPMFDLSPWFVPASEVLETTLEATRGRALVHCLAGVSRSATIVCAYLLRRTGLGPSDVIGRVRSRRRCVNPNAGFVNQLRKWDMLGYVHFSAAEAAEGAARMAERMRGDSALQLHTKLTSLFEVALVSSASSDAERRGVAALGVALDRNGQFSARECVDLFLHVTRRALENDEATDCPAFPGRLVEVVAEFDRLGIARDDDQQATPSIGAEGWRGLLSSCVCGTGDQFGFDPFAFASLLHEVSSAPAGVVDRRCVTWVHLFAARVRSILEAGTPMAFPPDLKVNFSDLDLAQLDEWTPALRSENARRVLQSAVTGQLGTGPLADRGDDDEPAKWWLLDGGDVLATALKARIDDGDEGVASVLADPGVSWLSASEWCGASVVASFTAIGDPLPSTLADRILSERYGPCGPVALAALLEEARTVLEVCDVDSPFETS